jgi:hypothetical protein
MRNMPDFQKVVESMSQTIKTVLAAHPILREIDRLRNEMSGNALKIGTKLKELRGLYTPKRFADFMRKDLFQDHGISRSTGYRWMVLSEKLSDAFPNSIVRDELMRRIDARGIFSEPGKDRKDPDAVDPASATLTSTAREALSTLPAPPAEPASEPQGETPRQCYDREHPSRNWARLFIKAMNKARARQRADELQARKNPEREQESILRKLERLAVELNPNDLQAFRNKVDHLLQPQNPSAAQSQFGTEANGKTPADQTHSQSRPESVNARQGEIPRSANISQSQSRTGNDPAKAATTASQPSNSSPSKQQPAKEDAHSQSHPETGRLGEMRSPQENARIPVPHASSTPKSAITRLREIWF